MSKCVYSYAIKKASFPKINYMKKLFFFPIIGLCFFVSALSGQSVMTITDLLFARTQEGELQLDLYLPESDRKDVLIIWVHGGAWRSGSKEDPPKMLLKHGYPLASINYRLSPEAAFPAQIHDIKAAVRFLKSKMSGFNYPINKIVLWGSSAGGHLAALAGLSYGNDYLEGVVGQLTTETSEIQGIIDFYGPSNLSSILDQSTPHGLDVRIPALDLLLGDHKNTSRLSTASPIMYVEKGDPPIFIAHGEQDLQVPINQSIELYSKCQRSDVKSEIHFIPGNGHGGMGFENHAMEKLLLDWITKL